jgi:methylthioxylose transferase
MALAAWGALVVVGLVWGARVGGAEVSLRAAPLMGRWDWRGAGGLIPAAVVGASAVRWGPRVARTATWSRLLVATAATTAAWTVALAASDGWDRVTQPLTTRHEYEPLAARVDDLGSFVSSYVDDLPGRPIHVQGHPPGPVVLARLLDAVGLGGAGWLAALAVVAWGGAMAAALVAMRKVAGEQAARRAAPALVVLPAAVWAGTSLDALFAGVVALAVAAAAVAATRRSRALAGAAGAIFGVALLLTYGAVPLVVVAAAATVGAAAATAGAAAASGAERSRPQAVRTVATTGVFAGAAALGVLGLAAAAGFWWPAGLDATRQAYWAGVASVRPAAYLTFVGNPAALALAVGPAVFVGLATLAAGARRHRRAVALEPGSGPDTSPIAHGWRDGAWSAREWILPVAALSAVVAADLSQYARGEVERIWLPFVPWLALAAPGHRRGWLAAQVAVGLALQAGLRSPW